MCLICIEVVCTVVSCNAISESITSSVEIIQIIHGLHLGDCLFTASGD